MEIYVKNASINFQCGNDGKAIGVRLWGEDGEKKFGRWKNEKPTENLFRTIIRKFLFTRFHIIHFFLFNARLVRIEWKWGLRLDCRFECRRGKISFTPESGREKAYATKKAFRMCVEDLTRTHCWLLNHSTKCVNVNYFRIQIVELNCAE